MGRPDFTEELAALPVLLARQIDLTGEPYVAPMIHDADGLSEHLPAICNAIQSRLSSRQLEATYQRCLALELESAGVWVALEVSVALTYKSQQVGTRRADCVLTTEEGSRAVVELKAVACLTSEHLRQLEFYMVAFDITHGYLVNFPHDSGFLELSEDNGARSVFNVRVLSGVDAQLSDRVTRGQHADSSVQVVQVTRVISLPGVQLGIASPPGSRATPAAVAVYGVTKLGKACKVCLKEQGFCKMHENQKP
ncbi:PD-XK nuclease superfamily-domain-containing protein [Pavlovales sp. CCMP2436]|nr:PD-XK nuclease superfamily-domain-containing protein [Pavlovales sp. CCMP2436]|mmetsp:Transcript_2613/g.6968  ORF Transcript_2613/g.6968 Transcript_2613/m.6968 type:complete len:252 (+) Transcript_2613:209-964(+)